MQRHQRKVSASNNDDNADNNHNDDDLPQSHACVSASRGGGTGRYTSIDGDLPTTLRRQHDPKPHEQRSTIQWNDVKTQQDPIQLPQRTDGIDDLMHRACMICSGECCASSSNSLPMQSESDRRDIQIIYIYIYTHIYIYIFIRLVVDYLTMTGWMSF